MWNQNRRDQDACILSGVNLFRMEGCSFEQCRIGLKLIPKAGTSRFAPDAIKGVLTSNYFEANAIDMVVQGVSRVQINSCNTSRNNTATIILEKYPLTNARPNNIEIDGGQIPSLVVKVNRECGEGVVIYYPAVPSSGTIRVEDPDGRAIRARKGVNPLSHPYLFRPHLRQPIF